MANVAALVLKITFIMKNLVKIHFKTFYKKK